MPRGKLLSEYEKGIIVAYKNERLSIRDTAKRMPRSPKCIWTFLKYGDRKQKPQESRKGYKISEKEKRALLRRASEGKAVIGNK